MATTLNDHWSQAHTARQEFASRLQAFKQWLSEHGLLDAAVQAHINRLESQLGADKVVVAFVAEFSRGKSELINALFFAEYGIRIVPASVGRTTMCPTEIAYDPAMPPALRLLPIETRLQPKALAQWRATAHEWAHVDLDPDNSQALASSLKMVTQTRKVTQKEAYALGFWSNLPQQDNPLVDEQGMVDVPRWRHALINLPHPLLAQGLVILDTPGLNAIGAEPELTIGQIPLAHAVVFMLSADTGVSQSDMAIWREHLVTPSEASDARLVVLNKIDTLWDPLSSSDNIQGQIDRQRSDTARLLGIPVHRVLAVSAKQGLVGKVNNDRTLLQRSCLPQLESLLAKGLLEQRHNTLHAAMRIAVVAMRADVERAIQMRQRELNLQSAELKGLRGKNGAVVKNLLARITSERAEFDAAAEKVFSVREEHQRMMKQIAALLSTKTLKMELAQLSRALKKKGLKLGAKRVFGDTFARLRANLDKATALSAEVQAMVSATIGHMNETYGFSLAAVGPVALDDVRLSLEQTEKSHLRYLGLGYALKLAEEGFSERLVRALTSRLRMIQDEAASQVAVWGNALTAQMDAQWQERRRSFTERITAIDRIQTAAAGLKVRVQEIEAQQQELTRLHQELHARTDGLFASQHDSRNTYDLVGV